MHDVHALIGQDRDAFSRNRIHNVFGPHALHESKVHRNLRDVRVGTMDVQSLIWINPRHSRGHELQQDDLVGGAAQ